MSNRKLISVRKINISREDYTFDLIEDHIKFLNIHLIDIGYEKTCYKPNVILKFESILSYRKTHESERDKLIFEYNSTFAEGCLLYKFVNSDYINWLNTESLEESMITHYLVIAGTEIFEVVIDMLPEIIIK